MKARLLRATAERREFSWETKSSQVNRLRAGVGYLEDGAFAAAVFSPMAVFFRASTSRSSSGPDQITLPSPSTMNATERGAVSASRTALVMALALSGCRSDRTSMLPADAEVSSDTASQA